jgi:hypothetical protein
MSYPLNTAYLVDQQISLIKTKGLVPTSQQTFTNQSFIDLMNDELQIGIVPFVMKNRSEYFVNSLDTSVVGFQTPYPIPTRAIGGKLRMLSFIDTSGNVFDVPQIFEEDLPFFNQANVYVNAFQFYFEGNNVMLNPQPTASSQGNLRFHYYQRPNYLVLASAASQVISVVPGVSITVGPIPTSFQVGTIMDIVNGTPGFECRQIDNPIASITPSGNNNIITFTHPQSTNIAPGDWLALQGQSPIPQIPLELFPFLNQRVVVKLMEAQGDAPGLQMAQGKLNEIEKACEH